MFAFLGQPEYKPAETGPEADARYRRMRWQVFLGAFIGYAGFYLVRKNLSMAIPEMEPLGFAKAWVSTLHTGRMRLSSGGDTGRSP